MSNNSVPRFPQRSRRTSLPPWSIRFLVWYVNQNNPSKEEQVQAAGRFATELAQQDKADAPAVTVSYSLVRKIKGRDDFKELQAKLAGDAMEQARTTIRNDSFLAAELRRWAMLEAKARGDVRAMAPLTEAYFDRAMPKQPNLALLQPQVITIQLTSEKLASFDEPPIEVTAELVDNVAPEPPKQLTRPRSTEALYRNHSTLPQDERT